VKKILSIFVLCVSLVFVSCSKGENVNPPKDNPVAKKDNTTNTSVTKKPSKDSLKNYLDSSYTVAINKSFKIKINIWRIRESKEKNHYDHFCRLEIYNEIPDNLLQTIDTSGLEGIINVSFDDFNFDGYKDLYLTDGCAILGNCIGNVFLFNTKNNLFEIAHEFDDMTTIVTNQNAKTLTSTSRCCAGAGYDINTYKYIDGKLTLVKSISEETPGAESDKYHYVIKELDKNGKMQTIKDVYLKEPKLDDN